MKMKLIPVTALEAAMSKMEKETEVAIYARITNPEGLKDCIRSENQHQLEGQFSNGVKCRVRKTWTVEGDARYTFTYKLRETEAGVESCREFNVPVDADFFEGFKEIAERSLEKVRYIFTSQSVTMKLLNGADGEDVTIPNVEYEVDVYTKADGTVSEWCKIDVEIDSIIDYLAKEHPELQGMQLNIKVSHLAFQPTDTILPRTATPEQKSKLDEIWKEFTQPVK